MRMPGAKSTFNTCAILGLLFLFSGGASANQILFTSSLSQWEAAAPGYLNVTSGYGSSSTMLGNGSVTYPTGTVKLANSYSGWVTWCCNYFGQVIGTTGTSATLNLSGVGAFGVEIEPNFWIPESMTVTLSNGQSITEIVNGYYGAQFFGFVGSGIKSITINDNIGDTFAFGNFYYLPAKAKVVVTNADLVSNEVIVQLSGTQGTKGMLSVKAEGTHKGTSVTYSPVTPTSAVGPGTYTLKFDRPNMPVALYTKIKATWNISPKPATTTYALPDTWNVLGLYRHTQYNTPHEALCPARSAQRAGYSTDRPVNSRRSN